MTTKRILVPLDGSTFSEHALPTAFAIARRTGHDVEFVSVYDEEPTVGGWALSPERVAASLKDYLERIIAEHAGEARCYPLVKGGNVTEVLVKEAGRWNVDLVVMATHGRGTIDRAWLGSVADQVVRHATVPVVLVRPGKETPPPAPEFRHILVALDGSRRAERCLDWAARIGGPEARYTLLQVVPGAVHSPSIYLPDAIREECEKLAEGQKAARRYLADVAHRLFAEGFHAETEVVEGVPPATGIIAFAERHDVDLVAITTHGRTGLPRLLLGSVADKVVRGVEMPVLVTRAE